MILYFTGTGNSRYAAGRLAEALKDELVSINDCMKRGEQGSFQSQRPYVFVTPTYMSRMPMAVEQWIAAARFEGSRQAYFVFTAGQCVGNAGRYCEKLCAAQGLTYQGTAAVAMPANYVAMYDVTPRAEARTEAAKADPAIDRIAQEIKAGHALTVDKAMSGHKSFSGIVPVFNALMVHDKGFTVSDSCDGCAACERICPRNNISLKDGRPVWGGRCIHCMACISQCHNRAIDYGKKTKDRNRYYLD